MDLLDRRDFLRKSGVVGGAVMAAPLLSFGARSSAGGALYETEDVRDDSVLYRYIPTSLPQRSGDLASSSGRLQALKLRNQPNAVMDVFPQGQSAQVEWIDIEDPDPEGNTVSDEAKSKGAAVFDRQEGIWIGDGKLYFDCTEGGVNDYGQIFELDPSPSGGTITLIYQSPGPAELEGPDNLVFAPTGDIFLCEDSNAPQYIRGLTVDGEIYDFARSITNESEFAGACFDRSGKTTYVNQQGPGVTYAIWGPW